MVRNWYQPDGFDTNDKPYIYNAEAKDKNDLMSVNLLASNPVNLERYASPTEIPVLDAVCAAIRFLAYSGDNGHLVTEPSRRFIYYNARALTAMDEAKDHTQWPRRVSHRPLKIREALRAVTVYGASLEYRFQWLVEEEFDYGYEVVWGINERPTDLAYNEASKGPILEPYRLDHYRSEEVNMLDDHELAVLGTLTLSKVRLCIAEGYPVIFAFHLYWDSFRYVEPAQSGDQGYPTIAMIPASRRLAGPPKEHTTQAALIVAFDHIKRRVLVQSMMVPVSFFWMSYEWIIDARATESFWMLRNSGKRGRREIENSSDGKWYNWQILGSWTLKRIPESYDVSQLPNSSIAVISRQEGYLDVFWISAHCTVERAYREPLDKEWKRETVPLDFPPGEDKEREAEAKVPLPGAIVAVSAHIDKLDIFWMSKNGAICNGSWRHAEPKWYTRRVLQKQDGIAEPRAGLAATIGQRDTPSKDKINVYCVGPDGSIKNIATTRSWTGTDTVTIVSGSGTAYQYTSLSAVAVDDLDRDDSSTRLTETVAWITPEGSITGKRLAKDSSWVEIWETKGQPNIAHKRSHISTTYFATHGSIHLYFFYGQPHGKLRYGFATLSFSNDTPYSEYEDDWYGPQEDGMVQENSDMKAVSWKYKGQWTDLVLWQNKDSRLFMGSYAFDPIQLSDNHGVRRGSPFGLAIYGEKPIMAMKLDDGFIGVGYWGSLDF
ncbi:cysteine ase [Fusarium acutatum]|uniref:Cysteine ase n=1 Tax=Fusarium acutatum TaxID=78861 RepID=A0A8H4NM98_9HYPO|nr:cysteine ase [Fusarium acutatum]